MKYILVPFLLAAHVQHEKNTWKYGAEYTFNIVVNTSLCNDAITKIQPFSSLVCKLICRSTKRDRLVCYISMPEIKTLPSSSWKDALKGPTIMEPTIKIPFDYLYSVPFELIFTNRGVKKYNFPHDTYPSDYFVNLSLAIVDQLNIGVTTMTTRNVPFRITEEFNLGRCPTDYMLEDSSTWLINPMLDRVTLKSIHNFEIYIKNTKVIKKLRHMDKCIYRNDYMFGANHMPTFIYGQTIKESISRMMISRHFFNSESVTTYILHGKNGLERKAVEYIKLVLESVKPAKRAELYLT